MKKLFTLLVIVVFTLTVHAQSPSRMSYQCVVRNSSGALVTNQTVGMRISILQGSATGTVIFSETYTNPQTNANGLVTVEIGGGTATVGSFSAINWPSGTYYLKTETDPAGGTSYTITGTSQLLSVPYALHAKTVETHDAETDPVFSASPASGITGGNISNWNTSYGWGNHSGLYRPVSWVPSWADVTGKPSFAAIATTGSFADLLSKPTTLAGYGITDADNSSTNELQALSLSGTQLSLSLGGGTVTLPSSGGGDNWGTQEVVSDATLAGNGTTATPLRIADNGVTSAKIADGAVATADLANSAVTAPKLASMGASTGQVLKWTGTTWAPDSDLSGSAIWSEAGSNIYYNSGRVGIGTSNPATLIHVHGTPVTSRGQLSLSAPSGEGSFLSFYEANEFKAYLWYDVNDDDLRLQNFMSGDLNLNPYGGKVGIGTNTPGYTLDVSGNINFTGSFTQNGSPFTISWTNLSGTPTTLEGYGITDAVKSTHDINFINQIQKGDKVLTTGGLYGKITVVEENFVKIEVEGVILRVYKNAIRKPPDY